MKDDTLVVGAGVSGLSCAIRLQEAGHRVRIVAEARTPGTTSDIAAAYYFPARMAPDPRLPRWGLASLAEFRRLEKIPEAGVIATRAMELYRTAPTEAPWWTSMVENVRSAPALEIPPGYEAGILCDSVVVQMPVYLRYLEARFLAHGGAFLQQRIEDVHALAREHPLVVNCTGLGAREAARDASMFAIRGQIVRIENRGISGTWAVQDAGHPIYVIARPDCVVLGGTAQEGDENREPDPATEARILRETAQIEPRLAGARVLSRAVGLRPGRPTVRVEREDNLIHDYGHAGSGVTLSWGCADDVVALAAQV